LPLEPSLIREVVRLALREDIGHGDITTLAVVPEGLPAVGHILARAEGVVAGLNVAAAVFQEVDPACEFRPLVAEGAAVVRGAGLAVVQGPARALLTAERTALNFLQHLSGIATQTRAFVEAVAGTKARIVDTRKTTPGLRALEKYAVRVGGGANHRFNLADAVLIKDNHIVAAGGIGVAVGRARAAIPHTMRIEVETETLAEVQEALTAGADLILLDNMDVEMLRAAVQLIGGRAVTEASGGVTLETVARIAATGVDYISVGALTHSVRALDISLELEW